MNDLLEAAYQRVGREIICSAPGLTGKVVCSAEGHDGVMGAGVYFDVNGEVRMRSGSDELYVALIDLWEISRKSDSKGEWRRLIFVIDGSKFAIRLLYPDEVDSDETPPDKRQAALIFEHFGATEWDDSDP
jgi:hypothetical protein